MPEITRSYGLPVKVLNPPYYSIPVDCEQVGENGVGSDRGMIRHPSLSLRGFALLL